MGDDGICQCAQETWTIVTKYWVQAQLTQQLPAGNGAANENGVGDTGADWVVRAALTGPNGSSLLVVLQLVNLQGVIPSFAACDQSTVSSVSVTLVPGNYDQNVYGCWYNNNATNDTVDVELVWDQNGNGQTDACEPVLGTPVTLTLADA